MLFFPVGSTTATEPEATYSCVAIQFRAHPGTLLCPEFSERKSSCYPPYSVSAMSGLFSLAILECRFCIWPCLNWLALTFHLVESQEVPKLARLHLVLQPEKLATICMFKKRLLDISMLYHLCGHCDSHKQ